MKTIGLMFLLIGLACLPNAQADVYLGLSPGISPKDIKQRYPNAMLIDLKPAWLIPSESFKVMSGSGIVGSIFMKFSTADGIFERLRDKAIASIGSDPTLDVSSEQKAIEYYSQILGAPLDERLGLDWVRWVPPQPVPLQRLISKYGNAEQCDYKVDTFEPYCSWSSRGVFAVLDDKKVSVLSLEFTFTAADRAGLPSKPLSKSQAQPKSRKEVSPASSNLKKTM